MAEDSNITDTKPGNKDFDNSSSLARQSIDDGDTDVENIAHQKGELVTKAGDPKQVQIDSGILLDVESGDDVDEDLKNKKKIKRRGKHMTRRGSKKNKPRKPRQKFKPYNTLTWDEKRKLGERDTVKAVRRRKELVLQKGRPIAPYNTTQFLMEEHATLDNFEEKVISYPMIKPGYSSGDNVEMDTENENEHLDESSSSSFSSDEYFDRDFNEFYERVHIDTLNSYSKEDLIKTVYELEGRIEGLERDARNTADTRVENTRLIKEIEELKDKVATS